MSTGYLQVTMYMSRVCHLQSVSVIVDEIAGRLIYFPALPNCKLIFHSSTGDLRTTSLMLQDLVFSVAWFSI